MVGIEKNPEDEFAHISRDTDYLVARSRALCETDPYAAKSWMITAKLMYPKNFTIQFAAFSLEKEEVKAYEAAKYLKRLFDNFGGKGEKQDPRLASELTAFVNTMDRDSQRRLVGLGV